VSPDDANNVIDDQRPVRRLRARLVFPVATPPIDGGIVTIRAGRIEAVGARADGPVEDLGDVALLPGLVNAHTHLELSGTPQPLGEPGIPFADWIGRLVEAFRRGAGPNESAVAAGLAESLRGGVTRLGDIAQPGWSPRPFAESPIRATVFLELIAPTAPRVEAARAAARAHVAAGADAAQWRPGLSPHAPYSVHPDVLADAVRLAASCDVPVAMHLAESREEIELLATGRGALKDLLVGWDQWDPAVHRPGRRPIDFLQVLAAAPRAMVVHGNYLEQEELDFLAEQADRMSVVYCPRTHAFFGHGDYPLARMLARGVRVALGTDSRASSPDLCLLAELRTAAHRHRDVAPRTLLEMATLRGAEALGGADPAGRIEPGRRADLLAVAPPGPPPADPHEWLVAQDAPVVAVWCGGRRVE